MAYSFNAKDHFNTLLYTGNESAGHAITGVGFQPDFTWFKNRGGTDSHSMYDIVRGVTKQIEADTTGAETTESTGLASFDSDGFTVGTRTASNSNNMSICSWNWKAGGAGSANSNGSTSSTVSANTTSGFSIVKYTNPSSGAPFTVGHGLGVAPKMIITKKLNGAQTWGVWHTGIGFGKYLRLDSTAAEASANLVTATSTTTFSTYKDHHDTGDNIIAYCFAEKTGFSRIGSYAGNSSADGPFLYCGFKPAWFLVKNATASGESWHLYDNKRLGNNPNNSRLFPNNNSVEAAEEKVDFYSNGVKIRSNGDGHLNSSATFIYMAFAEAPIVGTNGVPASGR